MYGGSYPAQSMGTSTHLLDDAALRSDAADTFISRAPAPIPAIICQRYLGARSRNYPCRKCRIPVNTIAMPSRFAASITSSSRTEPPG